MNTVLVAVGELLERNGLIRSVDWANCGMRIVAEASTGTEAWDAYRALRPDVIIVDMNLPGLNGLALIERIRKQDEHIRILTMVSVDTADLGREASAYKLSGCLVKATVTSGELEAAIERLRDELLYSGDADGKSAESDAWNKRLDNWIRRQERTDAFASALVGHCEDLGAYVSPCGMLLLNDDGEMPEYRRLMYIEKMIGDHCAEKGNARVLCNEKGRIVWAVGGGTPTDAWNAAAMLREELCDMLVKNMKLTVQFCIVEYSSQVRLDAMLMRILTMLDVAFYMTEDCREDNMPDMRQAYEQLCDDAEQTARRYFGEAMAERFRKVLMSEIVACDNPDSVRGAFINLLGVIRLDVYMDESMRRLENNCRRYIQTSLRINHLSEVLELYCERLHAMQSSTPQLSQNIKLAMEYIDMHYAEELTLEEVARHVYLSHSWFSARFKRETGLSYMDYITKKRIEKACVLLRYTDETVGAIAASLKFYDISHFSRIFKRQMSVRPLQYRHDAKRAQLDGKAK